MTLSVDSVSAAFSVRVLVPPLVNDNEPPPESVAPVSWVRVALLSVRVWPAATSIVPLLVSVPPVYVKLVLISIVAVAALLILPLEMLRAPPAPASTWIIPPALLAIDPPLTRSRAEDALVVEVIRIVPAFLISFVTLSSELPPLASICSLAPELMVTVPLILTTLLPVDRTAPPDRTEIGPAILPTVVSSVPATVVTPVPDMVPPLTVNVVPLLTSIAPPFVSVIVSPVESVAPVRNSSVALLSTVSVLPDVIAKELPEARSTINPEPEIVES